MSPALRRIAELLISSALYVHWAASLWCLLADKAFVAEVRGLPLAGRLPAPLPHPSPRLSPHPPPSRRCAGCRSTLRTR